MHLYVHKDRHVVVSETEKPEQGELQVSWVALVPTVSGAKKRGRRPNYEKPVPVADLSSFNDSDATDTLRETAAAVLAKVVPVDGE